MSAERLLETDLTQLFYRKGSSPYTLVTFNELGMKADGQIYWGKALAEKLDLTCLALVSKFPHWFPTVDTAEVAKQASRYLSPPVVCYGHSQGGYAALKYSGLFTAQLVISFCPQFSINPADTEDRRYSSYFKPDLHADMRIMETDIAGARNSRNFIVYDPFDPFDTWHAAKIGEIVRYTSVPAYLTGHLSVRAIASSELFESFLKAAFSGDLREMRQLIRSGKKQSGEIIAEMACQCFRRGKISFGTHLISKAEETGSSIDNLGADIATACLVRGESLHGKKDLDGVVRITQEGLKYAPTDYRLHARLGFIYAEAGELNRAELSFLRAINFESGVGYVHEGLADVLMRDQRFEEALVVLRRADQLTPESPVRAMKLQRCREQIAAATRLRLPRLGAPGVPLPS